MMRTIPTTMKTWMATKVGKPQDVLQLKESWPTPAPPKGNNLLIRVSHAALNPLDLNIMAMRNPFKWNAIPAVDMSGVVVQTGPAASPDIRVGMTVCGTVPTMQIFNGTGVLCEYVTFPETAVAEKPAGLDDGRAAGLIGVGGQTTNMLIEAAKMRKGESALVNGASGGVGVFLVQVLAAQGIRVTGICSGRNAEMVKRLGAAEVVDYTAHDSLTDHLSSKFGSAPFDAVFDLIGNEPLFTYCAAYVKPKGGFYNIADLGMALWCKTRSAFPAFLGGTPRAFSLVMNNPSGVNAKAAADWFQKGWIKEVPVEPYDFENVVEAYERLASKRAQGKIVIAIP